MMDVRNNNREEKGAKAATASESQDMARVVELVNSAAGGDVEAFGQLYIIHIERIYRYVFYRIKDKMTAEDIVGDVFLRAWKAIGTCRGKEQTFSSWLYRIANNLVIDNFRKRQKIQSTEREISERVVIPEVEIEAEERRQELLELIACLSENQRQVIILKFIEGLDNREIAKILNKREGAIRVLQMRALAKLRKVLGSEK